MNATQTDTPDLFAGTKHAPEAMPLRNRRREVFCQKLASADCYDNQTEAYIQAFGGENRDAAGASAARLMRDTAVRKRIEYLRNEAIAHLGIDRFGY